MINLVQGAAKTITITLKDTAYAAFNLTGYTMSIIMKRSKDDADSAAALTGTFTISTPANGIGVFTITSAMTAYLTGLYYVYIYITLTSSSAVTPIYRDEVFVEVK